MQAPKTIEKDDYTSDDWIVKLLSPGHYAIVLNVHYPGTEQAWHAWRMHFPVALHVAVSSNPPRPGGLWGLPIGTKKQQQQLRNGRCPGEPCGLIRKVDHAQLMATGSWKHHEKNVPSCVPDVREGGESSKQQQHHQRNQPDPRCQYGIKSLDGNACCPKECGRCGGRDCHKLPLGSKACCVSGIKEHSGSCSEKSSPCNLFGDGSMVVKTVMLKVTHPEGVSLIAEASFSFLNQHLALLLEGHTVGYSPTGRKITREVKYKSIPQFSNSYLDLDLGPGEYNITLVELGPAPFAYHRGVGGNDAACDTRNHTLLVYVKNKAEAVSRGTSSSSSSSISASSGGSDSSPIIVSGKKGRGVSSAMEKWQSILEEAAKDTCALIVDVPDILLPLPTELWAYRSVLRGVTANTPSSAATSSSLTQSPYLAAKGAESMAEQSREEHQKDAAAVVQSWGGDDWSRIHADGFNILRTSAPAIELSQIGIKGAGGAFAVRVHAQTRTVLRITAGTNMINEQLLYAVVNATGSFVYPTAHYPTQFENPALFVLEGRRSGSGRASSGSSSSGDPMDSILWEGIRGQPIIKTATPHDYYILFQPKRKSRNDDEQGGGDTNAASSSSSGDSKGNNRELGRDGSPCPLFTLDLAAAPADELHEWVKTPPSGSTSAQCVEKLPVTYMRIDRTTGIGSQSLKGIYTSRSITATVDFTLSRPSQVNATLVHNFMTGDFVVTLVRMPQEGGGGGRSSSSAGSKASSVAAMDTIATSEDNVFVFDRTAAIQQARHPSHPMLESHDVGAMISEDVYPGKYQLRIKEHTLRHFPIITGKPRDVLCTE
eukprot:jgi/Bigna1/131488/aug1.14_g6196